MNAEFILKLILKSFLWPVLMVFFLATSCQKDDIEPDDDNTEVTLTKVSFVAIPDVHPDKSSVIKVISLKNLILSCKENPQSQDVYDMFGLQRIEGYVIDEQNNDILIYSRLVKNWPKTSIFDFIESLRNVTDSAEMPYCSLDPSVQGIEALTNYFNTVDPKKFDIQYAQQVYGKQECIVGGVAKKSNYAAVMIDADYHMKKVSQGIEKLDSVKSTWDFWAEANYSTPAGMSRFWFNVEDKYPLYEESGNSFRIKELPIHISTMAQEIDNHGNLVDVPGKDPVCIKFAEGFSKQFNNFSLKNEPYAKLANLYYLQALTEVMLFNGLLTKTNETFLYFRKEYPIKQTVSYPDAMESVLTFKQVTRPNGSYVETLYLLLSGGVSVEMNPTSDKIDHNSTNLKNIEKCINFIIPDFRNTKKVDTIIDVLKKEFQSFNIYKGEPAEKSIDRFCINSRNQAA